MATPCSDISHGLRWNSASHFVRKTRLNNARHWCIARIIKDTRYASFYLSNFDFCLYFAADFPGFSSASERGLVELRKQRIPFTLQSRTQMFWVRTPLESKKIAKSLEGFWSSAIEAVFPESVLFVRTSNCFKCESSPWTFTVKWHSKWQYLNLRLAQNFCKRLYGFSRLLRVLKKFSKSLQVLKLAKNYNVNDLVNRRL